MAGRGTPDFQPETPYFGRNTQDFQPEIFTTPILPPKSPKYPNFGPKHIIFGRPTEQLTDRGLRREQDPDSFCDHFGRNVRTTKISVGPATKLSDYKIIYCAGIILSFSRST